jgi:hypothetical protein
VDGVPKASPSGALGLAAPRAEAGAPEQALGVRRLEVPAVDRKGGHGAFIGAAALPG